jgi:2-haloacid dehalogenase
LTDRRTILTGTVAFAGLARLTSSRASASRTVKAIAFDGFPIIDPRPVAVRAEALFPGKGDALMNAWRTRQFEYTWLRTLSGTYADFWQVTQDALAFATKSLNVPLDGATRDALMQTWLELKAWDDARAALDLLRNAGIRMAFLANLTAPMLDAAVRNARLQGFFEGHLSTDRVRAFKPHARAYEMGLEAFGAKREEIVFCASAGWDAAGAKQFGYRTFWVNRGQQPPEELGMRADGVGASLADLARFVLADRERTAAGL